ncbi:cytidylate kinase [Candidatus Termititenax aidoneus]|uniref:Cytidylate kinase n=1 Tax=Termititenax aidoneus TaxID=2218524 RepID=A0A388TEI6_TERA1|nr:cytidylate kinase [Candidatus Termititenax aidoneus]
MQIAIDGPAGSGKSTIAKILAKNLGFKHIDTGAYYRWVTYRVLSENVNLQNAAALIRTAEQTDFAQIDETKIRSKEVTENVSTVSALPEVRRCVVAQQRLAARGSDIVMEGRDIGSVVFPDAELKIFLTASVEERARRRYQELLDKGEKADLAETQKDIVERDRKDSMRHASPLRKVDDAVEVDTTGLTIEQVVEKITEIYKERK